MTRPLCSSLLVPPVIRILPSRSHFSRRAQLIVLLLSRRDMCRTIPDKVIALAAAPLPNDCRRLMPCSLIPRRCAASLPSGGSSTLFTEQLCSLLSHIVLFGPCDDHVLLQIERFAAVVGGSRPVVGGWVLLCPTIYNLSFLDQQLHSLHLHSTDSTSSTLSSLSIKLTKAGP